MSNNNLFWLLRNVSVNENYVLVSEEGSNIIVELSEDGMCYIWPFSPTFKNLKSIEIEAQENQDIDNYLVDGDLLKDMPCGDFDDIEHVLAVLNRDAIPLSYRRLGPIKSIRGARAVAHALTGIPL